MRPSFYDPKRIGTLYMTRWAEVLKELENVQVPASATDKLGSRVALLIIDMQVDFCHQTGSLYVPGAEKDIENLIEWILANFEKLTSIYASLDSHLLFQIFLRSWWLLKNGKQPDYFTEVYKDDPAQKHALAKSISSGDIRPAFEPVHSIDYTDTLMKQANKPLCIWPFHTEIGTPGQSMDSMLYEVLAFHALARKSQLNFLQKGQIPQTEMYGILSPEVKIPTHKQGGFNTDFLKMIMNYDKVIVAGEAKSHCLLESLKQIYNFFIKTNPEVLKKICIMENCMSSVKHPAIDFEAIVQAEFDKFRTSGINIMNSTDLKL